MRCGNCSHDNEQDAIHCIHCGKALPGEPGAGRKNRAAYRYAWFLIPALLLAAAAGYYKYILPDGVAAVVNGERVLLAELDGYMKITAAGTTVPEEVRARMRYAALSDLINERIAWQAAHHAGISVTEAEVQAAYDQALATAGGANGFPERIETLYGSGRAFRAALERKIGIRKFIAERLAAGTSDPTIVDGRVNRWLAEAVSRASVRIALAEQAPASGCGCCNPAANGSANTMNIRMQEAEQAVRAHWQARYGKVPMEMRSTDLGCHIQVDVMDSDSKARSFRYQNGRVSEL